MKIAQARQLSVAFANDGAANVVGLLIKGGVAMGKTNEEQVSGAMQQLEAMAEYQLDDACCLMIALWPLASDLMLHDVCDSIDLWICNNRSRQLIEYLRGRALSESDPGVRRHLEELLRV